MIINNLKYNTLNLIKLGKEKQANINITNEQYNELLKIDSMLLGKFDTNNIFVPYNAANNFNDYIFKYENFSNIPLDNFKEFSYKELCSFNEHNIAPYLAKQIGVYYNNERICELQLNNLKKKFGERKYRVGLMSDIHYNDYTIDNELGTYTDDGSEYQNDFPHALNLYQNKEDIKFICSAGDISSNDIIHILNFKKALDTYSPTTKFYSCFGNHDFASVKNESIPENELYDTTDMNAVDAWNNILTPNDSEYEIHYQDDTTALGKSSYWFEVPIEGTNKSDIYLFLSVNYDNDDSTATQILTTESPNIQPLIDYVGFMPSKYNLQLYDNLTLIWFKSILDQFKDKRIFIFTHQFFIHKAGSNNIDDNYYRYGGIGDRWRIQEDSSYCLCGIQFEFLNKLNNEYKNTIWFTGHSHYKWNWQTIDPYININNNEYEIYRPDDENVNDDLTYLRKSIYPIDNSAFNVHIPSTSRPLKISNGYDPAYIDSEGAIMDVYEDYVDIRGIIFKDSNRYTDKYYPLAQYRINVKAN